LFVVGVLTDVENVSEGGEFVRAHVSDPTGVFTLYSGQFQQEATDQLLNIDAPAFVAVVGKIRTYTPDDGDIYVSIRPETIREVNADTRARWILETCMQTKQRIGAVTEAMKMNEPNAGELRNLGYSRELSEGIVAALKEYKSIDVEKYVDIVSESFQYIAPSKEPLPDIHEEESVDVEKSKDGSKKSKKEKSEIKKEETSGDSEDIENTVLDAIKKLEGDNGAAWDMIMENCKKTGLDEDSIEEALTSLMDKGFIFEPLLGTIKTT
jgi:RPA family protein